MSSDLSRRVEALLPLVSKPSRYLGNEFHVVQKDWDAAQVRWCLLLPEVYEIGMSHWGLKILYDVLNRRADALAERCYAPWVDMEAQLRRNRLPLFSLESRRPLAEFDVVGFSLQYELTYTNILNCLDLAGIPLRAEDRRETDPLVIAGGPCVSNPEPLSDFIDLFLIGDGEEAVQILTHAIKMTKGLPRAERLRKLAQLEGIYVPLLYESRYDEQGRLLGTTPKYDDVPKRVRRVFIETLEDAPYPQAPVVPLQDIVQNRLTVEVLRGCTQGCRFCQAGYLYRPIRERSIEKILTIADEGIRKSGWDEVGLVSLSTADYTQLEPLADVLNARFGRDQVGISLPSLRADSFGVGVADRVKETKKTGFTFAPEAGSERLRMAMNKIIRDEEFFQAARIAYERGWRLIKMYFMIGLPTETWEDVEGIVSFVHQVRDIGLSHSRVNSVNASVGSFVPKSHTPLQWDGFEDPSSLREKLEYLKRRVTVKGSRLKWHHVEISHLEAIMSLGDRRLGRTIQRAFELGARFDGWTEHFNYKLWLRALEETGVDPAWYTQKKSFDDVLPWDHIDIGVLKKWLVRERQKTDAQVFELGKSLVADCRHGDCTACGIPGMPKDTMLTAPIENAELERLLEKARSLAPRGERASSLDVARKNAAGTGAAAVVEGAGVSWPVRIQFEKSGPCRFISHLETMNVLARAFRMARIPLAHSQGHHPHPKIAFGPSLPVGIEGTAELFDAELLRPWSTQMTESLNAVLPRGLRIVAAEVRRVVPNVKKLSLSAEIVRARYRLELEGLPADARRRMTEIAREFESRESCVVERTAWTPHSDREATDWEAPMDATAAVSPSLETPSDTGGSEEAAAAESVARRPSDRRSSRGPKVDPRRVDLKRAIHEWTWSETILSLDLYLAHPDGQTANPRVVLEQLFALSPEEQALVRIVREVFLDGAGRAVGLKAPRTTEPASPLSAVHVLR